MNFNNWEKILTNSSDKSHLGQYINDSLKFYEIPNNSGCE